MRSFLSGLGLFFLGIVITFIFFEAAFRVGGAVYRAAAHQRNLTAFHQKDALRVLCLGESTTEIGGEDSYPRQLERILNSRQNRIKFAVINGGIPGGNTDTITEHLPGNIENYDPHIVVLMMGINDVAVSLDGKDKTDLSRAGHFYRWIEKSRLVRLFTSLWKAKHQQAASSMGLMLKQPIPKDRPDDDAKMRSAILFAAQGKYGKAIDLYTDLIIRYKKYGTWPNAWFYRQLGDIYQKQGDFKSVVRNLGVILEQNPRDAWAVDKAQAVCRDNREDGLIISTLSAAIERNTAEPGLYQLLGSCYEFRGQTASAAAAFAKAKKLRAATINPVTKENYRRVIAVLNEKHIETFVLSYPLRSLSEATNILEGIAGGDLAVQVDNEKVFKDAVAQGRYEDYFIDRFAGDFGHCTPKGNHVLAENVAEAILKAHKI
ncbi:MAG: hypothetical protein IT395_04505 [Candidatus Omnitrophica bacterium]|nr:hypothetical protein [Candidatus Omnitrophota bacterium]